MRVSILCPWLCLITGGNETHYTQSDYLSRLCLVVLPCNHGEANLVVIYVWPAFLSWLKCLHYGVSLCINWWQPEYTRELHKVHITLEECLSNGWSPWCMTLRRVLGDQWSSPQIVIFSQQGPTAWDYSSTRWVLSILVKFGQQTKLLCTVNICSQIAKCFYYIWPLCTMSCACRLTLCMTLP